MSPELHDFLTLSVCTEYVDPNLAFDLIRSLPRDEAKSLFDLLQVEDQGPFNQDTSGEVMNLFPDFELNLDWTNKDQVRELAQKLATQFCVPITINQVRYHTNKAPSPHWYMRRGGPMTSFVHDAENVEVLKP